LHEFGRLKRERNRGTTARTREFEMSYFETIAYLPQF